MKLFYISAADGISSIITIMEINNLPGFAFISRWFQLQTKIFSIEDIHNYT